MVTLSVDSSFPNFTITNPWLLSLRTAIALFTIDLASPLPVLGHLEHLVGPCFH